MLLKPSQKLRTIAQNALNLTKNKDYSYNYSAALFSVLSFPQVTKEKFNC